MRLRLNLLLLSVLAMGCESVADPATGQVATRWNLPGTAAAAAAAQERWDQCVQFRSESFCERDLPGGRPPGTPVGQAAGGYPARNDP